MNSVDPLLEAAQQLQQQGRLAQAMARVEQALELKPDHPQALLAAGQLCFLLQRPPDAARYLHMAAAVFPPNPALLSNLSAAQLAAGDGRAAALSARQATELAADHFGAWLNLGLANVQLRHYAAAEQALDQALGLQPENIQAMQALARARYHQGRQHLALRPLLERILQLAPDDAESRALLADSQVQLAETAAGVASYRRSLASAGQLSVERRSRIHSALLVALQYLPESCSEELLAAHQQWHQAFHLPESATAANGRVPRKHGKLRIGWLSPRFGAGPVASFLLPVLEAFNRDQCTHLLYAAAPASGPVNIQFRALADHWCELEGQSAAQVAATLAADELDVLVDLAGHAPGGQLRAFSARPAALQMAWLDAFSTTGVAEMDVFLSDAYLSPAGTSRHFSERLLRLGRGRLCYRPHIDIEAPRDRAPDASIVFACFNRLSKLNDEVLLTWGRILDALPDARLQLRNSLFDQADVRDHFLARATALGLPTARLQLAGSCSYRDIMHAYHEVDIVLDPFPFSGCTTTCDALWMGVPVITSTGQTLASRQSAAILNQLGHEHWVAVDSDQYVALAVTLAKDREQRRNARHSLRSDLKKVHDPQLLAEEIHTNITSLFA